MPSLDVVLPPFEKGGLGGSSSKGMGMTCTGSDAAMMERREPTAVVTGLAREELMQRRAKMVALESRGRRNRDILGERLTGSDQGENKVEWNIRRKTDIACNGIYRDIGSEEGWKEDTVSNRKISLLRYVSILGWPGKVKLCRVGFFLIADTLQGLDQRFWSASLWFARVSRVAQVRHPNFRRGVACFILQPEISGL